MTGNDDAQVEPRSDWAAFSSRRERDEGEREEISGACLERPTILKDLESPWSGGDLKRGMNRLVRGGWAEKNEGV